MIIAAEADGELAGPEDMLNRCRTLLGLIDLGERQHAGGLSSIVLMKCAFLLSREFPDVTPTALYDFVPYKYGPFSFALYRDLDNLERRAYVTRSENAQCLSIPSRSRNAVRREIERLPRDLSAAVSGAARTYGAMDTDDLLRQVYRRFPWFTLNTQRPDLLASAQPCKPTAPAAVYTIGYQGRSVDGFFDLLLRKGIRTILDVRRNPVSRKYGFARSSMKNIAEKLDVQYVHMPQLGIPSARRQDLNAPCDYERLLDWYERTLPNRTDRIEEAIEYVRSTPSVLLCAEANPLRCHRGRLANAIAERTGMPVSHLD